MAVAAAAAASTVEPTPMTGLLPSKTSILEGKQLAVGMDFEDTHIMSSTSRSSINTQDFSVGPLPTPISSRRAFVNQQRDEKQARRIRFAQVIKTLETDEQKIDAISNNVCGNNIVVAGDFICNGDAHTIPILCNVTNEDGSCSQIIPTNLIGHALGAREEEQIFPSMTMTFRGSQDERYGSMFIFPRGHFICAGSPSFSNVLVVANFVANQLFKLTGCLWYPTNANIQNVVGGAFLGAPIDLAKFYRQKRNTFKLVYNPDTFAGLTWKYSEKEAHAESEPAQRQGGSGGGGDGREEEEEEEEAVVQGDISVVIFQTGCLVLTPLNSVDHLRQFVHDVVAPELLPYCKFE